MRLITKILSFLMLMVLLTAETCSDNRAVVTKEERMTGVFQDIEDDFVNKELSQDALFAFEKRAIQKVYDISDYLNIYADTSLSMPFRLHALQLIKEMFYDPEDLQHFYNEMKLLEDTVNRTLTFQGNSGALKIEIDSAFVSNNLRMKSFLKYEGEIQFSKKIFVIQKDETVAQFHYPHKMEMQVLKTEKQFGNKTEEVWEVFLK